VTLRTLPHRPSHRGDVGSVSQCLAEESDSLDHAIYDAVANTPTPTLDVPITWIANASNYSTFSIVIAGVLATSRGPRGRDAAIRGLVAVGATSIVANLVVKPLFARRRPTRRKETAGRGARMPGSSSFPSGHTASAFAFAAAVAPDFPQLAFPLYALATVVGYSRVHTGVHFPSDVMGGAVVGTAIGTVVRAGISKCEHVLAG